MKTYQVLILKLLVKNTRLNYIIKPSAAMYSYIFMKIITELKLPASSQDLLIPDDHILKACSLYEVLRHYGILLRLSPFRFEDFCAALSSEDQSNLLSEIHIALLKSIIRAEEKDGDIAISSADAGDAGTPSNRTNNERACTWGLAASVTFKRLFFSVCLLEILQSRSFSERRVANVIHKRFFSPISTLPHKS